MLKQHILRISMLKSNYVRTTTILSPCCNGKRNSNGLSHHSNKIVTHTIAQNTSKSSYFSHSFHNTQQTTCFERRSTPKKKCTAQQYKMLFDKAKCAKTFNISRTVLLGAIHGVFDVRCGVVAVRALVAHVLRVCASPVGAIVVCTGVLDGLFHRDVIFFLSLLSIHQLLT